MSSYVGLQRGQSLKHQTSLRASSIEFACLFVCLFDGGSDETRTESRTPAFRRHMHLIRTMYMYKQDLL